MSTNVLKDLTSIQRECDQLENRINQSEALLIKILSLLADHAKSKTGGPEFLFLAPDVNLIEYHSAWLAELFPNMKIITIYAGCVTYAAPHAVGSIKVNGNIVDYP